MPTYVYECRSCSKVFEVEQRIVAEPLTDCDCGAKESLRRLIQPTAVMFRGEGFFVNDSTKSAPKTEESTATDRAEPAPTTTESQTVPKTEANPKPPTATAPSETKSD